MARFFTLEVDQFWGAEHQSRILTSTSVSFQGVTSKAWVRSRGPESGGANEGTPEFYINDPDGIRFQLQDLRYCGGPGVLGDGCPSVTPLESVLVVRDFQSFTLSVPNQERSLGFYQALFGATVKGQHGTVPMLGVGSGPQRLRIDGSAAAGATPRVT